MFRILNVVDDFTRECLAIEVDTSLSGVRVIRVRRSRSSGAGCGLPRQIRSDNGPEFLSRAVDQWSYAVAHDPIRATDGESSWRASMGAFVTSA